LASINLLEVYIYIIKFLIRLPFIILVSLFTTYLLTSKIIFSKYNNDILKVVSIITIITLGFTVIILGLKTIVEDFTKIHNNILSERFQEVFQNNIFTFYNPGSSMLSNGILILVITIGFIIIYWLGERQILEKIKNINIFFVFVLLTYFMVYTNNILIMFLSLLSLIIFTGYCLFFFARIKILEITTVVVAIRILVGIFLIIIVLIYIYKVTGTFNYEQLLKSSFSNSQRFCISLIIFLGFSNIIPMIPLDP